MPLWPYEDLHAQIAPGAIAYADATGIALAALGVVGPRLRWECTRIGVRVNTTVTTNVAIRVFAEPSGTYKGENLVDSLSNAPIALAGTRLAHADEFSPIVLLTGWALYVQVLGLNANDVVEVDSQIDEFISNRR